METNDTVVKRIPPGLRPWFVIGAGVTIQFTYGIVYTFGNLLPYLVSYLRWKVDPEQTAGAMVWLQSLMASIPFAMLAGGYMERKVGARMGVVIGSLLYTGFIALSYFAIQKSFFLLLLTFGFFSSFGQGMAYNCILIQCQRWLPHRIGLVGGLITAGFGSGAFIIAPIQTKFINPDNLHVNADGFFTQEELLERVPKVFLLLAMIFGVLQLVAVFFIANPAKSTTAENESLLGEDDSLTEEDAEASARTNHSDIFYSGAFALLFLTLLLNGVWIQTASGLFKAFGQQFIQDDFFLATVNSFAAGINCLSRVVWGAAADKTSYQTTMSIACAIGAVLMWTLSVVKSIGNRFLFMFWICGMFGCIGATFSLVPYGTHRCFGGRNFGIAYGAIQIALGFSGVITALCSQFFLPMVGYERHFLIMGSTIAVSLLLTQCLHRTKHGRSSQPRSPRRFPHRID
ncbi:Protein F10G7.5 a [Aphelenchoides avenae]|nr:Protein F10G7.5 a [Aphelenchus avenae]